VFVKEYHENPKGQMKEKPIHDGGDVPKSVQRDDRSNEHNYII
jgi:hypothetical protein